MPPHTRDGDNSHSAPATREQQADVQGDGYLNFVCEPGAITIEAAEAGEGDGMPKLPRFSMVAYTGGPMRIAGWRFPVVVDLAGLSIPSQSRPIRFGHDMASGVGHTDAIRVEEGKLLAAGVVSRDTAAAREIVVSAANGFPWQASIGAAVEEFEFIKAQQTAIVNGREFSGPINVIRKATLGEISFVDLGADGQTTATVTASGSSFSQENHRMDENDVTNAQQNETGNETVAAASTAAEEDGNGSLGPTVAEIRAQAVAETNRIAGIREVCGGHHPEIEARAIQQGWTVDKCTLEVLRASRPKAPAAHFRDNSISGCLLQAA